MSQWFSVCPRIQRPKFRSALVLQVLVLSISFLISRLFLEIFMGTKTRQILLESEQYFLKAQSLEEQAKSNEQDIVQLRESIEDTKKQIDKWQCQEEELKQDYQVKKSSLSKCRQFRLHQAALQGVQRNRLVTGPPYCTVVTPSQLPKFLFVAGIEGSGHHALLTIWESLKETIPLEIIVYDQVFHVLDIEQHASYHYSKISLNSRLKAMSSTFQRAAARGATVIDAQNSYPMGEFAGSLAHPDLLQLQKLDGILYDFRVVVLYRDPADAVMSAVRRFRSDGPRKYKSHLFQARMAVESLVAINNALPQLGCGKWVMFKYEDIVRTPSLLLGPLARLLGVSKTILQGSLSHIKAPTKRELSVLEKKQHEILNNFFHRQEALWPILASLSKAQK